jgi:lipoprotein-anchoring transpeptidase ErfK/SrfK
LQGFRLRAVALLFSASLCLAADADLSYRLKAAQPLSQFSSRQITLLEKLNRVDRAHLGRMKKLIVPNRWDFDELAYSPMPQSIPGLASEPKTVVVDVPSQVFGAYQFGTLVRWGPVCSGSRANQTPPGHYTLHWNARVRISSVDPTWIMPWYFNFDSVIGLGFHEYTLPGRPSSHGCIRMLEPDARWLFYWGRRGTPVLVKGEYDFAAGRPWLQPGWRARGIAVSSADDGAE